MKLPPLAAALLLAPLAALQAAEPPASSDASPRKELPLPGEVFVVEGHTAFIIPARADPAGGPKRWVWYAPTLPNLPGREEQWMFEQFRDAGIAVAGIDVGESYGSPAGRKLFTAFHAEMAARRGFSRTPVLLGRSRGGLMLLAWAAENPDSLSAFAGIYPVCNLSSYPGVDKAAGAYEMTAEELQAHLAEHNPVDRLAGLAKVAVPFFAIHGDVDTVVPLDANSGLVKERYTSLGGTMELVVAQGQGHNMWTGFFQSQDLVRFVKARAKCRKPDPPDRLTEAQRRILERPPQAPLSEAFRFDAPPGPSFTDAQKQVQREAGARVVPLVIEAWTSGVSSVRVPPGDYRFGKERWGRDGVIFPLEFSGLQRDDEHPFTIDAAGATFWFDLPDDQAPACHFCVGFKDCRNIVFRGATIDRATRGHVEGRITQFDFSGHRIEIALCPGISVPESFNDKLEQRVIPFKADGTFCAPLYALQGGGVRLKYKHIGQPDSDGRCWVTMVDPALLDTVRDKGLLKVGDGLSCVYAVSSALELVRCRNMTMDGLRVYGAKAWSAEREGFGAHLWKDCYVGPRPGTSQWQGGEGFMFNATRHGTTLDSVTIRHTADDTANFHGYWSPVASASDRRVTFGANAETRRALPRGLELGDRVFFFEPETGAELNRATVAAIEGDTVSLDRPAGPFARAIAEWPDHECAGWTIQNCNWSDNYQRLLIQSGPGAVRNCRFTSQGSSIELNSVLPYVEGGVPRDIRIENNVFTDVNPGGAAITVYAHTFRRDKAPTLRNIVITGNTFDRPAESAIELTGVEGAVVANNTFEPPPRSGSEPRK
jgi:hypothetical protein